MYSAGEKCKAVNDDFPLDVMCHQAVQTNVIARVSRVAQFPLSS